MAYSVYTAFRRPRKHRRSGCCGRVRRRRRLCCSCILCRERDPPLELEPAKDVLHLEEGDQSEHAWKLARGDRADRSVYTAFKEHLPLWIYGVQKRAPGGLSCSYFTHSVYTVFRERLPLWIYGVQEEAEDKALALVVNSARFSSASSGLSAQAKATQTRRPPAVSVGAAQGSSGRP